MANILTYINFFNILTVSFISWKSQLCDKTKIEFQPFILKSGHKVAMDFEHGVCRM